MTMTIKNIEHQRSELAKIYYKNFNLQVTYSHDLHKLKPKIFDEIDDETQKPGSCYLVLGSCSSW